MKYEWQLKDAQAIGNFMGEVECTLKIICAGVLTLAAAAVVALGYWVLA